MYYSAVTMLIDVLYKIKMITVDWHEEHPDVQHTTAIVLVVKTELKCRGAVHGPEASTLFSYIF